MSSDLTLALNRPESQGVLEQDSDSQLHSSCVTLTALRGTQRHRKQRSSVLTEEMAHIYCWTQPSSRNSARETTRFANSVGVDVKAQEVKMTRGLEAGLFMGTAQTGSLSEYQALIFGVLGLIGDKQAGRTAAERVVSWGLVYTMCIRVTSYASVTSHF